MTGDIIKIKPDQRIPADIVILYTQDQNERAYIRTDQLDGETDLKLRRPVSVTHKIINREMNSIFKYNIEFVIDNPNSAIYRFQGSVHIINGSNMVENAYAITLDNTIWTNCVLQNTVIYG